MSLGLNHSSVPFPSSSHCQPIDTHNGRPRLRISKPADGMCPICKKLCPDRQSDFARHMEGHEMSGRWLCPLCPHSTSQKANCETHIRSIHTLERNQICEQCGESWTDPAQRSRHKSTGMCPGKLPIALGLMPPTPPTTPKRATGAGVRAAGAVGATGMMRSPSGRILEDDEIDVAWAMTQMFSHQRRR